MDYRGFDLGFLCCFPSPASYAPGLEGSGLVRFHSSARSCGFDSNSSTSSVYLQGPLCPPHSEQSPLVVCFDGQIHRKR